MRGNFTLANSIAAMAVESMTKRRSCPNRLVDMAAHEGFHPVGGWKTKLSSEEIPNFEVLMGHFLQELG